MISHADSQTTGAGLSPGSTLVLGAVTGLALGYLFFTDHGRQFRERLGPTLDTWLRELSRLRDTADKARLAYAEGRDSLAAMARVTPARHDVQERL
ncbi:MAG: YtxH domain-containing protein [Vicinamibacteria bacterium]|nr:YtxH domain-containing protein [Vicinamibacteria bacterium]